MTLSGDLRADHRGLAGEVDRWRLIPESLSGDGILSMYDLPADVPGDLDLSRRKMDPGEVDLYGAGLGGLRVR